jgi:beta-RFAP synthase
MGFLDLNGSLGRQFGSIGLAIDAPRMLLSVRRSDTTRVDGPEQARATRYLNTIVERLDLPSGHSLRIGEMIPAHAGLGSGTQLALGIAAAVRRLHGLPLDPRADAHALGRGRRSGVGIALFQNGGLVVDGGSGTGERPPPLLARLDVPADWRVVVILDTIRQGLSGQRETAAFGELAAMSEATSARICRLVLMQALPAIAEDDIDAFGAAVTEVQAIIGDYFSPVQGGRFYSPRVAAALSEMAAMGAAGIGQSSWGPTGFVLVRGDMAAWRLVETVSRSNAAEGLDIRICRALNHGAAVIET